MQNNESKECSKTLRKCPFCGGEAKIDKTITNTVSVECTVCHASSRIILCTEGDIEQKAIKAWNTRKPMERIVERLEEYRDDFMNDVYEELREDADNCRANRIIDRFDEVTEIVKEEGGMNEIM